MKDGTCQSYESNCVIQQLYKSIVPTVSEMTELDVYSYICWVVMVVGVLAFATTMIVTAPYGRHYQSNNNSVTKDGERRTNWGPKIPNRLGWVIMEAPSSIFFWHIYRLGRFADNTVPLIFLGLWQCHYIHRSFLYPLRTKTSGKQIPMLVVFLAIVFNLVNSYINARWISELQSGRYDHDWLLNPRFIAGIFIFFVGMIINIHSDSVVINLRRPGEEKQYKIPLGGAYRFVSSPNYLGELIEWGGWALATWSLSGVSFLLFTATNLVPRAISNHRWYRESFKDYPSERKCIIPYIF